MNADSLHQIGLTGKMVDNTLAGAMKAMLIAFVLLSSCGHQATVESKPPVTNDQVKAAIEKAIESSPTAKVHAELFGKRPITVGPIFIDSNKGRARFLFEGRDSENQATLEKATDGRWYITLITIMDVAQGSTKVNVLIE